MTTRLTKNIVYNLLGKTLLIILSFVAIKLIFGRLGEDALGIIFFAAMLNALISNVMELGLSTTTTREVSANLAKDPKYIDALIATGSLFFWGIALGLGLAIYFAAPILAEKWINLTTLSGATATATLRVLGMTALVALPKSFYASLFNGLQRMEFNNGIDVISNATRQIGAIIIINYDGSLLQVANWFAFCFVAEVLAYGAILSFFFSPRALVPKYDGNVVQRNLRFASNMSLITLLWAIYQKADKAVISKFLSIGMLGFYGFAQRVVSLGSIVSQSINSAALPSFSALSKKEDRKEFMSQYQMLHESISFGNVPILAFIPFFMLPIFSYLLSDEVARLLFLPTTLLCIGAYLDSTLRIPITCSLAMGKPQIARNANFYALMIVFPLALFLVYRYGLLGAASAVVVRMAFFYAYAVPKICVECLGLSVKKWFRDIFRILLIVAFSYGVAWLILSITESFSVLSLISAYSAATLGYLFCSSRLIGHELRGNLSKFLHIIRFRTVGIG